MKQRIGTMLPPTEPVTDLSVAFVAFYNLIAEKLEEEPNKGIVVSKGNPNQRKATWSEVMEIAHTMEDYFILRKVRLGCKCCNECTWWRTASAAAPHIGCCGLRKKANIHAYDGCKEFIPKAKHE